MEFRTKLDFSSNRQIKQYPETNTVLSGATSFGVPFSALTSGPDLTTSAITTTITGVTSTFSGNSGTTVYSWGNASMIIAYDSLSPWTTINSGTTQFAGPSFSASSTSVIDENTVATSYTGVSFDLIPTNMVSLGGGNYSGTVYTNTLTNYSAGTSDFTGRTIWVDVSGITRTQKLILTNVGAGPGVVDIGVDATGMVVNQASDIRLKENIQPISNALGKILSLNGVSFNWVNKERGGYETKIGLIAQEVKNIVPELVGETPDGYLTVNYKDIPALLIEAIKEIYSGSTITLNNVIKTQTISAEDNSIILNFNGTHKTSRGGGIIINNGIDSNLHSEFIIDNNGNWTTNNSLIPKSLVIPEYTPISSSDKNGIIGDITRDDDFIYIKTSKGWKRTGLEPFN